MRRKLEALRDVVRGFVEQRERLLLVVSSTDIETIYVLKTLDGVDQGSPSDLVLRFAEPFTTASRYVSSLVQGLRDQAEVSLPAICGDDGALPHRRLRAAVDHVAALVPAGDHRVIWALFPVRIDDREGYARLVAELLPWRGPEPWMKGLRFVTRDDRARPFLLPGLRARRAPGVLLYEPDLSTAALTDALAQDAADRDLPVAERMEALMQLAALDVAYRRDRQAIEKYGALYAYYGEHRAPAMQAVVLQGMGDLLRRAGDLPSAREKYQQGLALAMQAQALPVLLNLTFAAGDVSLDLGEHAEAEGYLALSARIAGKLLNAHARADCLERQGIACLRAGDDAGALLVWRDASALCEAFGYHERRRSVLERLIAATRDASMTSERRAYEAELRAVREALREEART